MIGELVYGVGFSALTTAAALLVVLALRRPLRVRFGARVSYASWVLVPAAALIALLPAPVVSIVIDPAAGSHAAPLAAAAPEGAPALPRDPTPWLAAVWIAGVVAAACALLRQQRRFVRALGGQSRVDAHVFRAASSAGCPALVGAWRPRIVVPADFEQRYDAAERTLILAHERMHRARGDAQLNALAALLRCLYWFNPLFHIAAARFRFDQELACDALVIARFPEARRTYADAMLKTQLAELGLPVGCHWQSSHPLKERIVMLKRPLPGRTRAVQGAALVVALAAGGGYAAWAAQPPNEVKPAAAPANASADRAAGYRAIGRIDYPQDVVLNGDCVGVVTYAIDANGAIANLLALTVHGSAPQASCSAVVGKAAAGMMAKPWTFEPALAHGKAVPGKIVVPLVFTAKPEDAFDGSAIPTDALDPIRISGKASAQAVETPGTENTEYRRMYAPQYPPAAVKAHQQGRLMFKVLVDAQGVPQTVDLDHSEPPEVADVFTPPSVEAIRHWRFNPPLKHGKPQSGYVLVPIDFTLVDDDAHG